MPRVDPVADRAAQLELIEWRHVVEKSDISSDLVIDTRNIYNSLVQETRMEAWPAPRRPLVSEESGDEWAGMSADMWRIYGTIL
jgi:hypothetical protein